MVSRPCQSSQQDHSKLEWTFHICVYKNAIFNSKLIAPHNAKFTNFFFQNYMQHTRQHIISHLSSLIHCASYLSMRSWLHKTIEVMFFLAAG
jgi:bifunctional pyridoxal-dependent enzyme with beta-cystathionase and maltose regulon repressor activities